MSAKVKGTVVEEQDQRGPGVKAGKDSRRRRGRDKERAGDKVGYTGTFIQISVLAGLRLGAGNDPVPNPTL